MGYNGLAVHVIFCPGCLSDPYLRIIEEMVDVENTA
jgi:pyruvate/2-oxoacid:ferredoxin oxidoreductase beta subunit